MKLTPVLNDSRNIPRQASHDGVDWVCPFCDHVLIAEGAALRRGDECQVCRAIVTGHQDRWGAAVELKR